MIHSLALLLPASQKQWKTDFSKYFNNSKRMIVTSKAKGREMAWHMWTLKMAGLPLLAVSPQIMTWLTDPSERRMTLTKQSSFWNIQNTCSTYFIWMCDRQSRTTSDLHNKNLKMALEWIKVNSRGMFFSFFFSLYIKTYKSLVIYALSCL